MANPARRVKKAASAAAAADAKQLDALAGGKQKPPRLSFGTYEHAPQGDFADKWDAYFANKKAQKHPSPSSADDIDSPDYIPPVNGMGEPDGFGAGDNAPHDPQSLADKFPLLDDPGDIRVIPGSEPARTAEDAVYDTWAYAVGQMPGLAEKGIIKPQPYAPATVRRPEESIREYIARLRQLQTDENYRGHIAAAMEHLERRIGKNIVAGFVGPDARPQATQEYLDYLAANGVDQRTIDDVASGALPMDAESRDARAKEMGLDPDVVWYRWDHPLKTQFKGYTGAALSQPEFQRSKKKTLQFIDLSPSKEGLVYTSHDPEYAHEGVQIPRDEISLYQLLGANDGIVGIDRMPQSAYDTFEAKKQQALKRTPSQTQLPAWILTQEMTPELSRALSRNNPMGEHLTDPGELEDWHSWREHGLRKLRAVRPGDAIQKKFPTIPEYGQAESRKVYLEPLMATGAKGTLVRDETGLATAFTPAGAKELRHAALAPLDPRFKKSRNILQSLLAPVAVGGAAAAAVGSQPPMLNGLSTGENR